MFNCLLPVQCPLNFSNIPYGLHPNGCPNLRLLSYEALGWFFNLPPGDYVITTVAIAVYSDIFVSVAENTADAPIVCLTGFVSDNCTTFQKHVSRRRRIRARCSVIGGSWRQSAVRQCNRGWPGRCALELCRHQHLPSRSRSFGCDRLWF